MTTSSLSQAYQFYQQNLRGNALSEVDAVLAVDPTNAEAHNLRGAILERMGQRSDALAAYEAAVRYAPNYAAAKDNALRIQSKMRPITLPSVATNSGDFGLLGRIATLATGASWVVLVLMGCVTLFTFVSATQYGFDLEDLLGPVFMAILGLTLFVLLIGFGQGLRLLLTIENGNRQNARMLQSLLEKIEPTTPASPMEPTEV